MSEYSGNIRDLPVVTGGHFIENSTKKIVFGPEGRFWDDYVMRLFTLEPFDRVRKRFCGLPPLPVRAAGKLLSPELKAKIRSKLK